MGEALVRMIDVHKSFGSLEVLKGIDLEVAEGEVVCLLGPSGSGKSTLLRCINHLERVTSGQLTVEGELVGYRVKNGKLHELRDSEVCARRQRIGIVFQNFNLFPHMTAAENVMAGPVYVQGLSRTAARERTMDILERVGMASKEASYPRQLSGGQQQRVAIARALATDPKLILFDEPTSALDPELVGEVLTVMRSLAGEGMTMIIVTHEIEFARDVADRIVFMDGGVVVEQGPPEEVLSSPRHERTRSFLARVT